MPDPRSSRREFCDAIRNDDVSAVGRLLKLDPSLAQIRWPGRSGDGKMRSLGPRPFNQHTWHECPADYDPDDPRFTSTPLIYSRNDSIVNMLVESGADVNARGTSGEIELPDWFLAPLWRACHDGRIASVRLLVERGADVNYRNPDGSNQALKTAAETDRAETCDCLLSHGAEPDLITASMLGLADRVASILKENPAAIDSRDSHGRRALDAATLLDSFRVCRKGLHEGHDRAAKVLIDHGATIELPHAAALGMFDVVRRIIKDDPEILRRATVLEALIGGTATPESALQAARRRGRTRITEYLIANGATEQPEIEIR